MAHKDELGTRMKLYYENIPKAKLIRRTPVAIRIDGKSFHTFTKKFEKPFDSILMRSMQNTMLYLCKNIQGCVMGYTQSDEITLILIDYQNLDTAAWFDYEVQKMCSIAASMATMAFNRFFMYEFEEFHRWVYDGNPSERDKELNDVYYNAMLKGAMFDARCFNIPKEEVCNLIYWRQLDAIRNSIQMVGQANFSHKELQGKSCNNITSMLLEYKGIDWSSFPVECQRGSCCFKREETNSEGMLVRNWYVDRSIPLFKNEGRARIEDLIYI